MANEPTIGRGHQNPTDWVSHAQKMLNMSRPAMSLEELAENGTFDAATEGAVRAFQDRAGIHVDGVVGPDTWAALWQAVTEHQQAQAASPDAPSSAGQAAQTTPAKDDTPPTYHDVDRGREVVDHYVDDVVQRAEAFAKAVSDLGEPNEVLPKLLDGAHTGVDLAEILGAGEASFAIGQALFVGSIAGAILVPFAMWYEAIGANNAGELTTYRWQVYHPFVDGFIAGLYGESPRDFGQLFNTVRDHAFAASSAFDEAGKKGALAFLLATSDTIDYIPDADNPNMTAAQWALAKPNFSWTRQGLENTINHREG